MAFFPRMTSGIDSLVAAALSVAEEEKKENVPPPRLRSKIERCDCPICITGVNKWPGIKKFHSCHMVGCTKTYRTTSHLRAHLRSHLGIRPYKCTEPGCSKDFLRSDELTRHVRTHKKERNYPCMLCEKRFLRSDHLSKHVKSHDKVRKPRQKRQHTEAEVKLQPL